jgi:hypothetical protein
MTKKISITRALVELKRFDQRIAQALTSGKFVDRTVGRGNKRKVPFSNASIADTEAAIRGSYDKVDQLIKNRAAMKSKIVLSNATVNVTVLGTEMTVAEAIELKSSVSSRQHYVNVLRAQLLQNRQVIEVDNAKLQTQIDTSLNSIYGTEKAKIDAAMVAQVADPQRDLLESELLDPVGIEKRIEKLQEEISEIMSEIDFVLSEANARTEIEVDF